MITLILLLILIIILILLLKVLLKGFINYIKAKPVTLDSVTIQNIYQIFCAQIKTALKAPSTAVFCKENELLIKENNGIYYVSGWVDSQNSFGALMRTHINNFKISNINGILVAKSNIHFIALNKILGNLALNYVIGIILSLVLFMFSYSILL